MSSLFCASYFENNRRKLLSTLPSGSFFVAMNGYAPVRNGDVSHDWRPDSNFFYLTGIEEEGAILLLAPPDREYLFILPEDPLVEKWEGPRLSEDEASLISGIEIVDPETRFLLDVDRFLTRSQSMYISVDKSHQGGSASHLTMVDFCDRVRRQFPGLSFRDALPLIAELRTIKQEPELKAIRQAAEITREGLYAAWREMKPGMTESQVAARVIYESSIRGAQRMAYPPIVASGERAAVLHHRAGAGTLEDGESVLFDVGAEYNFYSSDISRCAPVSGRFSSRDNEILCAVTWAQEESIKKALRPGIAFSEFNEHSLLILGEALVQLKLVSSSKDMDAIQEFMPHGIGHLLGLDVHDIQPPSKRLEIGQVWTVEPGIYSAEKGFGFRVEDDVWLGPDGPEVLTGSIEKDPKKIEAYCLGEC